MILYHFHFPKLLFILIALAATCVAAAASQDPVEVSGHMEYSASSSSSQGEYENINSATTHMQIDETVTSGRVHIGVLSGDSKAWKNPAIEIEEEYTGTYHIFKNFTINNDFSKKSFADGWLSCCGGRHVFYLPEPVHLSADDVFNCSGMTGRR